MEKEKLVVIGNGMAGLRCVEEILERDAKKISNYDYWSRKISQL
ncbi:hypothetical protein MCOL2_06135 [Listeria fleischmannii FSL S10-1203]|uniref:Uncharacterized protein n=1 Tax=Listeria fleischmannii FSL S10-1203 TaxID=1265822 RepID=W7DNG4_9LIST|nr:hypothetical protein MCOL2_06135 [Listeria fleischmannii FSL S10-1203]